MKLKKSIDLMSLLMLILVLNVFGGCKNDALVAPNALASISISGTQGNITQKAKSDSTTTIKTTTLVTPVTPVTPIVTAINSLNKVATDMDSSGQALPEGISLGIDWTTHPRISCGNTPKQFTAVLPWGQVYHILNAPSSTNTRVQLRNIYVYYLSKSQNKWILWTGTNTVDGNYYVENYVNDTHVTSVNIRSEATGGNSVKLISNYNYQFWSTNGRVTIADPSDIAGVWAYCEARLIVDDPTKPDDRSSANYILSTGSDYWLNTTILYNPLSSQQTDSDIAIGRFKIITNNWNAFNMSTLTDAQVKSTPPPINSND